MQLWKNIKIGEGVVKGPLFRAAKCTPPPPPLIGESECSFYPPCIVLGRVWTLVRIVGKKAGHQISGVIFSTAF